MHLYLSNEDLEELTRRLLALPGYNSRTWSHCIQIIDSSNNVVLEAASDIGVNYVEMRDTTTLSWHGSDFELIGDRIYAVEIVRTVRMTQRATVLVRAATRKEALVKRVAATQWNNVRYDDVSDERVVGIEEKKL